MPLRESLGNGHIKSSTSSGTLLCPWIGSAVGADPAGGETQQDQAGSPQRARPRQAELPAGRWLLQRPRSSQVGVRRRIFQLQLVVGPSLVVKFKILNLSHQMKILHVWNIKSKRNKKLIA